MTALTPLIVDTSGCYQLQQQYQVNSAQESFQRHQQPQQQSFDGESEAISSAGYQQRSPQKIGYLPESTSTQQAYNNLLGQSTSVYHDANRTFSYPTEPSSQSFDYNSCGILPQSDSASAAAAAAYLSSFQQALRQNPQPNNSYADNSNGYGLTSPESSFNPLMPGGYNNYAGNVKMDSQYNSMLGNFNKSQFYTMANAAKQPLVSSKISDSKVTSKIRSEKATSSAKKRAAPKLNTARKSVDGKVKTSKPFDSIGNQSETSLGENSDNEIVTAGSGGQTENQTCERAFLWDLEDTLVIFNSLLSGVFAQKFGKDPSICLQIGLRIEELILAIADSHLFYSSLEDCDQINVDDVLSEDNMQDLSNYDFVNDGFNSRGDEKHLQMGNILNARPNSSNKCNTMGGEWTKKLAFRYRRIKEIYQMHRYNLNGLLTETQSTQWTQLRKELDIISDSWDSMAFSVLQSIRSRSNVGLNSQQSTSPSCVNILVSSSPLIPTIAKVLIFGLAPVFDIENIYSAAKIGKEVCFERIAARFGKKSTYVVVGNARDEERAARSVMTKLIKIILVFYFFIQLFSCPGLSGEYLPIQTLLPCKKHWNMDISEKKIGNNNFNFLQRSHFFTESSLENHVLCCDTRNIKQSTPRNIH